MTPTSNTADWISPGEAMEILCCSASWLAMARTLLVHRAVGSGKKLARYQYERSSVEAFAKRWSAYKARCESARRDVEAEQRRDIQHVKRRSK